MPATPRSWSGTEDGLVVSTMWRNDYDFISQRARDASAKYGVKSMSLLAVKSSG
jgi:hypothetical protein